MTLTPEEELLTYKKENLLSCVEKLIYRPENEQYDMLIVLPDGFQYPVNSILIQHAFSEMIKNGYNKTIDFNLFNIKIGEAIYTKESGVSVIYHLISK